jgi:hypothetical protein
MLKDGDSDLEYADIMRAGLGRMLDDCTQDHLTLDQALDYAFKTSCHDGEPQSFHEAMQRPAQEHDLWYKAALDEIQSLCKDGTFELVQLPPGHKAIGSRWVFKIKKLADGSIE